MELIFRPTSFKRVGGWCKPMGTGGKVSLRSRAAESSKSLRLAPLPWQRACLSSVRWPFFGNRGGTAIFSSPRLSRLGDFLSFVGENVQGKPFFGKRASPTPPSEKLEQEARRSETRSDLRASCSASSEGQRLPQTKSLPLQVAKARLRETSPAKVTISTNPFLGSFREGAAERM
jgi:hypothetical protein